MTLNKKSIKTKRKVVFVKILIDLNFEFAQF